MSKLNNFRTQWQQAPVMQSSEFDTPDDGIYRIVIEDVQYTERDKDNNETDPTFIYILRVVEGQYENMKFRKFTTLRTEKNLSYMKLDLVKLGLPVPADPEDLPDVHCGARGIVAEVTVKSREYIGRTYKDVYFDRLVARQQAQAVGNPFVNDGRQAQAQAHAQAQAQAQNLRQYAQPPAQQPAQPPTRQAQSFEMPPASYQDAPFDPDAYGGIPF